MTHTTGDERAGLSAQSPVPKWDDSVIALSAKATRAQKMEITEAWFAMNDLLHLEGGLRNFRY